MLAIWLASICILCEIYQCFIYGHKRVDLLTKKREEIRESYGTRGEEITGMDVMYVASTYVYMASLLYLMLLGLFTMNVFGIAATAILILWLLKHYLNPKWHIGTRDKIILIADSLFSIALMLYAIKVYMHI